MTLNEAIDIVEKEYGEKDYDVTEDAQARLQELMPDYVTYISFESDVAYDLVSYLQQNVINRKITELEIGSISLYQDYGTAIAIKLEK
jgi:hypothetical protein